MKPDARIAVLTNKPARGPHERRAKSRASAVHGKAVTSERSAKFRLPHLIPLAGSRRLFLKAGMASLGVLALWLMDRIARQCRVDP